MSACLAPNSDKVLLFLDDAKCSQLAALSRRRPHTIPGIMRAE
jgi:hypothetical protein